MLKLWMMKSAWLAKKGQKCSDKLIINILYLLVDSHYLFCYLSSTCTMHAYHAQAKQSYITTLFRWALNRITCLTHQNSHLLYTTLRSLYSRILHILDLRERIVWTSSRCIFFFSLRAVAWYHFWSRTFPCRLNSSTYWICLSVCGE